nr:unnamed protein product [Callosobruchus chinensis]
MGIEHVFGWYQQKIGTYDKQRWETKIEQREQKIIGLNHVQTRSTKPNTDLIDLDLVRGSSFTKAKPQHGFIKVTKLATLRCIFFPLYGRWWIKQTSNYVFIITLIAYIAEVINIKYYFNTYTSNDLHNSDTHSFMEIFIPALMMWVLSLVHSQIVATSPNTEKLNGPKVKRKVYKKKTILKKSSKLVSWNDKDHSIKKTIKCNGNVKDFNGLADSLGKSSKEKMGKPCIEKYNGNSSDKPVTNGFASSDSESETNTVFETKRRQSVPRKPAHVPIISVSSLDDNCCDTDEEDEEEEGVCSGDVMAVNDQSGHLLGDLTSSATDWMGVTTNSEEECSYSSDLNDNLIDKEQYSKYDTELAPTAILNPPSGKVSCIIWECDEIKKADLSMLDISSTIIGKVESMPECLDYFYVGICFSIVLAALPLVCRLYCSSSETHWARAQQVLEEIYLNVTGMEGNETYLTGCRKVFGQTVGHLRQYVHHTFNGDVEDVGVLVMTCLQRWILSMMIFFLLTIAERTFKQRVLYAKLFSHLTSSRRARKSELPHFRLNKVINIKTWLSVRSYLKRRGPQRSVDVIVSTAFIANLLLLTFLCVEVLKDSIVFSLAYMEALMWCLGLGIFLLRFMTLGTKINKKYRNLSVLITEQINLHLQIEQKPHKKDELNVANNVLKLAIDLLKELENPFKISGLSANPILYNVTKLVILSALSGVFSEILGFKLKLHKIKLK